MPATFALGEVVPSLQPFLIDHYTFDDPLGGGTLSATERDLGLDATNIQLVNGAPRVSDGAWSGSQFSVQTGQKNTGPNDDWKAGVMFPSSAASTLAGTKHVTGITVMGWFKPLGTVADNPSPNTNTPNPSDFYNAFGLGGFLRGDESVGSTDGHAVRALLEVINGKVTGLGRRLDNQAGSGSRASTDNWDVVMPPNQWTHLAATFDFDHGAIELYKNGQPLASSPASVGNWALTAGVDFTSNTAAGGIKIGGSYPDNSQEFNPFNGRADELMFYDRTLTANQVAAQFRLVNGIPGDFDHSGQLGASDIDLLYSKFGANPDFDLTGDGIVAQDDIDVLVRNLLHTSYGDANLDGKVDAADLGALALHWQSSGTWADGDFNHSGIVDVNDLSLLAQNWQAGTSLMEALAALEMPPVGVPEPALVSMCCCAAAAFIRPRWRRHRM